MNKRGQVTLFVILGIILIGGAFAVLYTQTEIFGKKAAAPEIAPIVLEIQNCVDKIAFNGITLAGLQGGYTIPPNLIFASNLSDIAYGYYEGRSWLLSLNEIEREIGNYVSLVLPRCVDFSQWPDYSVTANESGALASVLIKNNLVKVDVRWPVTAKKGDSAYNLDKFSTTIPIRLGLIYNITKTIVTEEIAEPDVIDISYFVDVYTNYGIKVDVLPYNDTIVYSITDPLSKFKDDYISYTFLFANKFK
jgi:hypothetical protein